MKYEWIKWETALECYTLECNDLACANLSVPTFDQWCEAYRLRVWGI